MSSAEIFYLALVLFGLIGFGGALAYFASQDFRMRKARAAEEAALDARRPAKPKLQDEFAKAA